MERDSSSNASSRKRVRGWYGLGSIRSISISCGPWIMTSRAGAAAAPPAVATGAELRFSTAGAGAGSGSRMSAPSPRPNAFLGIGNHLLAELRVALGPFTVYVIENNRLTEAWGFGEPYIAGNYTLKDLCSEKAAQICRHLA